MCIFIHGVMGKLLSKLPNIRLAFHFIRCLPKLIRKYLEILQIKFIPRNHHWLQSQPADNFGIFCNHKIGQEIALFYENM